MLPGIPGPRVPLSPPASRGDSRASAVFDLVVRGGVDRLAHLTAADVIAEIDFGIILLDTTGLLTPAVRVPRERAPDT